MTDHMTPQQLADLAELRAKVMPELLSRDADWRMITHGDFLPSLHKCAADMIATLADEVAALTAELARVTTERDEAVEFGQTQMFGHGETMLDLRAAEVILSAQDAELARLRGEAGAVRVKRLSGPYTHVCWTPDGTPKLDRELVSLVREADLLALESRLAALEPAQPDAGVSVADAAKVILTCHTVQTLADAGIAMDLVDTLRALAQSDAARHQGEKT